MGRDCRVVFAIYSEVTPFGVTGPFEVLSRLPNATCVLASVSGGTVRADGGMAFANVARLADITECVVLCVPGGFGTFDALKDETYLFELRRLAASARYVTSVCTGSLLLAAAGVLDGKRTACHWVWRDMAAQLGMVVDPSRVVRDGNVITSGGIAAGVDMALMVVAEIAGPRYAHAVQLAMDYSPASCVESIDPEGALPQVVVTEDQGLDMMRPHLTLKSCLPPRSQSSRIPRSRIRIRAKRSPDDIH